MQHMLLMISSQAQAGETALEPARTPIRKPGSPNWMICTQQAAWTTKFSVAAIRRLVRRRSGTPAALRDDRCSRPSRYPPYLVGSFAGGTHPDSRTLEIGHPVARHRVRPSAPAGATGGGCQHREGHGGDYRAFACRPGHQFHPHRPLYVAVRAGWRAHRPRRPRFHCSFSAEIGVGVRRACSPRELRFLNLRWRGADADTRGDSQPAGLLPPPTRRSDTPATCTTTPNRAGTSVPHRGGEPASSTLAPGRRSGVFLGMHATPTLAHWWNSVTWLSANANRRSCVRHEGERRRVLSLVPGSSARAFPGGELWQAGRDLTPGPAAPGAGRGLGAGLSAGGRRAG